MTYTATNVENRIQIYDMDAIEYVGVCQLIGSQWYWIDIKNGRIGNHKDKRESYKQLCDSIGVEDKPVVLVRRGIQPIELPYLRIYANS